MKNYTITVNGVAYDVTVEENSSSAPVKAAAKPQSAAPKAQAPQDTGSVSIEAPMPGSILDVKVKAGDTVEAGSTLIILEAMKMENDIVAPSTGTIISVNVSKGDSVDAGQVLLTLN